MDATVVYNIPHQQGLQVFIAIYFYLTGLSAGSFVISVVAYLLGKTEYKPLGKIGAFLAPILLVIAPILLVTDLGKPMRFFYLFFNLNPTSPLTWGTFLLTIYPISCLIYLYYVLKGNQKMIKTFGIIGIPLAISVHGYTGFVLALAKFSPIWNNSLMPLLWLISAMVSGIGLVIFVAIVMEKVFSVSLAKFAGETSTGKMLAETAASSTGVMPLNEMLGGVGKYLAGFIIFDLFLVFSEILVLLTESEEAAALAASLLTGDYSFLFLGLEILLGALIPLFLLLHPRTSRSLAAQTVAAVLVLIGVMTMRYIVIIGGQSVPFN